MIPEDPLESHEIIDGKKQISSIAMLLLRLYLLVSFCGDIIKYIATSASSISVKAFSPSYNGPLANNYQQLYGYRVDTRREILKLKNQLGHLLTNTIEDQVNSIGRVKDSHRQRLEAGVANIKKLLR